MPDNNRILVDPDALPPEDLAGASGPEDGVPTRLEEVPANLQEGLINWGYAITDPAMRKHIDPTLTAPADFPYRGVGI